MPADREGHSKALEAARRAYTLALPVALVAKSKMTLQSGANAMFYAAEIIPVVSPRPLRRRLRHSLAVR